MDSSPAWCVCVCVCVCCVKSKIRELFELSGASIDIEQIDIVREMLPSKVVIYSLYSNISHRCLKHPDELSEQVVRPIRAREAMISFEHFSVSSVPPLDNSAAATVDDEPIRYNRNAKLMN